MKVGVPKEIKTHEYRVGIVPQGVRELVTRGHEVFVERDAGSGIGADDGAYVAAGARIVEVADAVFAEAELIVKVKEPQDVERRRLRPAGALHLFAPCPRSGAGAGARCVRMRGNRIRDRYIPARRTSAADADV